MRQGTIDKDAMKKISLILLCIVPVLLAGMVLVGRFRGEDRADFETGIRETAENRVMERDCKSDPNPVFSHPFTDLSKIGSLGVLGGAVGGSPGRSYVVVKNGEQAPLYNPGDAVLETIIYAPRGGGSSPPEYGLLFRASCEVTYFFDHIDSLSEDILEYAPKEPAFSTALEKGVQPHVFIKAGTPLGLSDGTSLAHTFDFLLLNTVKPASHINPRRWTWEQAVYADCPYDYFDDRLKKEHYALLGLRSGAVFTRAQSCGSPSQDVSGTLSGGWFQEDGSTEGEWVMFGQQFNWMEMGMKGGSSGKPFTLKEYDPSITPDQMTPGQSACFQGYANNWAYVRLLSENELALATGEGRCPSGFPESMAKKWFR